MQSLAAIGYDSGYTRRGSSQTVTQLQRIVTTYARPNKTDY